MLVLLGLDHRRASGEIRGRLTFSGESLTEALRILSARPDIDEVAVLSTCNRTEIYLAAGAPDSAEAEVMRFYQATIADATSSLYHRGYTGVADAVQLNEVIYKARGMEAVAHLFHVSAGLRSMVIGEAQILGQVRDALAAAESSHTAGEELRAAFSGALQAGKRVRSDTGLSRADVSIAALAIHAARAQLGTLSGKTITLIGAGRTNQLSAQLLQEEDVGQLYVANRNPGSAQALAELVGATPLALDDVSAVIAESDALICATAAPYPIVDSSLIHARSVDHPLLVIDLAMPGDVTADVGALPHVTVLTLDTLRDLPGAALDDPAIVTALTGRQSDIEDAERILDTMLTEYKKAQTLRLAAPGIASLRRHVDRSEEQELERALAQLSHLSDQDRAVIQRFGSRLVDKMFHHLVRRIRVLAEYDEIPTEVTMRVLARLFEDTERPRPDDLSHP